MAVSLTYRERFERTLKHEQVDRPPMDLGATDMTAMEGGARRLAPLLGIRAEAPESEVDEAVLQRLDIDIRGVGGVLSPAGSLARQVSPTEVVDAWGIGYSWNGHHHEAVTRPLAGATIHDLEQYAWPDAERLDAAQISAIAERARFLYEDSPYVVCARHPCLGVMELGCWMCGYDDFLYRMAAEPEFVNRFFEIILAYQKRVIEIYYSAVGPYIHFTTSGDDFGTQTGPFMSPRMFDALVIPYLSERIRYTRTFTDAAFFHHSCGSIYALIPSLIAAGVDILNPLQPRAKDMEPDLLKGEFGDTLTFYGGVDTQELLRLGTPDEVGCTVRDLIGVLGQSGGYILSAAHTIQSDVPLENVVALFGAAQEGPYSS